MILPRVRDPRDVTNRRGGILIESDHRLLALRAASCAERPRDDVFVETKVWIRAAPEGPANTPVNLTNTNDPFIAVWPAWSPDGTRIAFWHATGAGFGPDAEIYLVDVDGTDLVNLTNTAGATSPRDWGPRRQRRHAVAEPLGRVGASIAPPKVRCRHPAGCPCCRP